MRDATIYTIGHSTRTADELIAVLSSAGVRLLADVRRYPASRRHPQHRRAALEQSLPAAGIGYVWLGESLGGRQPETVPAEQSRNAAWQVAAFRHYADAMATDAFRAGIATLEATARATPTAIMCAERLWWSCHRRLIADYLTVHGWTVIHLLDPTHRDTHRLPDFARIVGGELTYPAQ